jgi:hypothetical protein
VDDFLLMAYFASNKKNDIGGGARQGLAKDAARLETGGVWRVDC